MLCGKVTPIFKSKGSSQKVSNYRLISLTSVACKIKEQLFQDKLLTHFSNNNLISKHQHGFPSQKSTITQLLQCVNDWFKTVDKKGLLGIIYLDITEPFDSASHKKLLSKLENEGITG